jgi:hypothetical protein
VRPNHVLAYLAAGLEKRAGLGMAHTIERAAMDGPAKASKPDAFTSWYTIWCCAFLLWNDVVGYLDDIYNFYILIVFIILPPLLFWLWLWSQASP